MTKKKEKKALSDRDRAALKAALKELKVKRQEAVGAKDALGLKKIRQQYKKTNRALRRSAVVVVEKAAVAE